MFDRHTTGKERHQGGFATPTRDSVSQSACVAWRSVQRPAVRT